MGKKLFFEFSDNADVSNVILTLEGCISWIENDDITEEDAEDREYTLRPIYMTDEEFDNLPEADI